MINNAISLITALGIGSIIVYLMRPYIYAKIARKKRQEEDIKNLVTYMFAYVNPDLRGFVYRIGGEIRSKISREEAHENLIASYASLFFCVEKSTIESLKDFISNPDISNFYRTLNVLRKERKYNKYESQEDYTSYRC